MKPTRGRPKKPKSERRSHVFEVGYNDEERARLQRKVEAAGLPRATYVRRRSLEERVVNREKGGARELLLGKAHSLPDVSAALSSCGYGELAEDVEALLEAISRIVRDG